MPRQHQNRNVRRERDPRALTRQAVLLVCGLLLAVGFVLAARQKFVAINYGYESENLRRERERLKEEHRHLLLKLEETTTPAQLERAAREIGLQPTRAAQLSVGMEVTDTDATTPQRHASPAFVGATTGGAAAFRR
jgi:cell division protein FtsL